MRDREDLIAALADGSLDPSRVPEAEALVASDPDAAALLAAHRTAIEAAAVAATVTLTDEERSHLHSRVADAVGMTVTEAAPARRFVASRWPALATSAVAALFMIIALPLSGLLSGGGVGSELERTALRHMERSFADDADAFTGDPVLSFGAEGTDGDDAVGPTETHPPGGTVVVEPPTADAVTGDAASRDPAEPTTTTVAVFAEPDLTVFYEGDPDGIDDLLEAALPVDDDTACAAEGIAALLERQHRDNGASTGDVDDSVVFHVAFPFTDGRSVTLFFSRDADGRVVAAAFVDPSTCESIPDAPGR